MRKLNLTKALKNALPYVLTLILVSIMTFVAEILGEGEIIFPEITALAIGYMVTQKQGWKVNDSRMIALIAICAVAGVLTVRYIKVGLYLEILIATVYKGNIIKNLIMDCQSYTKYRPNETTGGIFVSWRRKEELPTGA
jgi:hypothetical protein